MALTLENLTAFVATVDKGGFRQAAATLGKHASTVSVGVANLEVDLGVELFIRHPKSLEITAEGTELYDYALNVLKEVEHLEAKADSLMRGQPDELRLAIDSTLRGSELASIYQQILQKFPQLKLKVSCGDPLQVRSLILSGQADVGFSLGDPQVPHALSIDNGYSFKGVRVISPKIFTGTDEVPDHLMRSWRQIALSFVEERNVGQLHAQSNRLFYCNNVYEILEMVKEGLGWALLPRFICEQSIKAGEVVEFIRENEQNPVWYTNLLWLSDKPVNAAMKLFMQQVRALPDR